MAKITSAIPITEQSCIFIAFNYKKLSTINIYRNYQIIIFHSVLLKIQNYIKISIQNFKNKVPKFKLYLFFFSLQAINTLLDMQILRCTDCILLKMCLTQ